jgi:ATP-dependent RNA helicase DHX37/DHR1
MSKAPFTHHQVASLAAVDNEEEIDGLNDAYWAKGAVGFQAAAESLRVSCMPPVGTGLHALGTAALHRAAPAVGVSFVRETDNATDESEEHGDDEKAAASAFRGGGKLLSAVACAFMAMLETSAADNYATAANATEGQSTLARSVLLAAPRGSGQLRSPQRPPAACAVSTSAPAVPVLPAVDSRTAFYARRPRPARIETGCSALPIFAEEHAIMEAIQSEDVIILCGETGSGKTTQLPQFLYEAGYAHPSVIGRTCMIGVTQPRRVAAVAMAQRVAQELCTPLGGEVAYQVRHSSSVGKACRVKFMTDGVLLREISSDLLLSRYSVVVMDEAHERSVNTDLLLGLLSRVVKLRRKIVPENARTRDRTAACGGDATAVPLKLIIMSATLQVETFRDNARLFAAPPPVITVDARQFPVVTHFTRRTPIDHLKAAYRKCVQIHSTLPPGGILVFLTGKADIDELCARLSRRYDNCGGQAFPRASNGKEDSDDEAGAGPMLVLPLYSMLPASEQMLVWSPPPQGTRLVVVATNVAETSITIPRITYVVDCGKVKQRTFSELTAVAHFEVGWISQASANQRAGRAGRVGPGHCYRLFSSSAFTNLFEKFAAPEIRRASIEGIVLQMKSMGVLEVTSFPFPEPPPSTAIRAALAALAALGATAAAAANSNDESAVAQTNIELPVTPLGRLLSRLPISPRIGKFLLAARRSKMLPHALPLAAMLALPEPFAQPDGGQLRGDMAAAGGDAPAMRQCSGVAAGGCGVCGNLQVMAARRWVCMDSDALCLLGVYLNWRAAGGNELAARSFSVVQKVMREAELLTVQLTRSLSEIFADEENGPAQPSPLPPLAMPDGAQATALRHALVAACPDRVARSASLCETPIERQIVSRAAAELAPRVLRRAYIAADHAVGQLLWLPTRSPLSRLRPRPCYVIFLEVFTSGKRPRLACASAVEPAWLTESAPSLTRLSPPVLELPPMYDAALDAALCWRTPTYGKAGWTLPAIQCPPPRSPLWLPAALFGRALCCGQVFNTLKPLASEFEPRAKLLSSATVTDRAVLALRKLLEERRLESRKLLATAWGVEPGLLLREMAALLEEPLRAQLVELWPRMLMAAATQLSSTALGSGGHVRVTSGQHVVGQEGSRAEWHGREKQISPSQGRSMIQQELMP